MAQKSEDSLKAVTNERFKSLEARTKAGFLKVKEDYKKVQEELKTLKQEKGAKPVVE